eukprot:181868_1
MEIDLTPNSDIPDKFEEIFSNIYVNKVKNISDDDIYECNCDPKKNQFCGVGCLNRMYSAECHPEWCNVGSKCKNRRFQNNEWASVEIGRAGKKGWGLFASANISKGKFVIEYIGEIIDSIEVRNRLRNKYFGSKKFFILSIGGGNLIDATVKGSKARFMNHSCKPNCSTQKWNVLGKRCIGFFAIKNINKGEELTFDYQFQRYGEDLHPCYCGEKNCRKFLGSSKQSQSTHNIIKHNNHNNHHKIHNTKQIIIYRKMNKKVQLNRHIIYLKNSKNYNINIENIQYKKQ